MATNDSHQATAAGAMPKYDELWWTTSMADAALREGWVLSDSEGSENGPLQIQALDDPSAITESDPSIDFDIPTLTGDDAAWDIVRNGEEAHHVLARELLGMYNPAELASMLEKAQVRITAVAVESAGAGSIDWYRSIAAGNTVYGRLVEQFPDHEINMFTFLVPPKATTEEITAIADDLMYSRTYTPVHSHNRGASVQDEPEAQSAMAPTGG